MDSIGWATTALRWCIGNAGFLPAAFAAAFFWLLVVFYVRDTVDIILDYAVLANCKYLKEVAAWEKRSAPARRGPCYALRTLNSARFVTLSSVAVFAISMCAFLAALNAILPSTFGNARWFSGTAVHGLFSAGIVIATRNRISASIREGRRSRQSMEPFTPQPESMPSPRGGEALVAFTPVHWIGRLAFLFNHQCEALRDTIEKHNRDNAVTRALLDYVLQVYGPGELEEEQAKSIYPGRKYWMTTRLSIWAARTRNANHKLVSASDEEVLIAATCGLSRTPTGSPVALGRLIPSIVAELDLVERRRPRTQSFVGQLDVTFYETRWAVRYNGEKSHGGFRAYLLEKDDHAAVLWMDQKRWARYLEYKKAKGQGVRADVYKPVNGSNAQRSREVSDGQIIYAEAAKRDRKKGQRFVMCPELPQPARNRPGSGH